MIYNFLIGKVDPAKSPESGVKPVGSKEKLSSSVASVVQGFREFCHLVWVLHARDKMSLCARKYRRLRGQDADSTKVCVRLIRILLFRTFLTQKTGIDTVFKESPLSSDWRTPVSSHHAFFLPD